MLKRMAARASTRRRWFPFGLRSLLIATAIVAMPIAWVAKELRQSKFEDEFGDALYVKKGGGDVDYAGPYDTWESVRAGEPPGWWRTLARERLGSRILLIGNISANADDLASFARLSNLQYLHFSKAVADLAPVGRLTTLKVLFLPADEELDLAPLHRLTRLKHLALYSRSTKPEQTEALQREQVEALQKALPNCKIHFGYDYADSIQLWP